MSQWSENGNDAKRAPVSQLFTRQNTIAFVSSSAGAQCVNTIGSYLYVRCSAVSQADEWKTEAFGCVDRNGPHRLSVKGLK